MSGGGSQTKQETGPPAWAVPYFRNFLERGISVADQPYRPYTEQRNAGMNQYQVGGLNAQANRALMGSPVNAAAGGELTRTLSGGYLNNNPYLDQLVRQSQDDVINRYQGIESRAGSFGNAGVNESMTRALGDVSANIRGADYANERNRMTSAVGMAPTIANQDYVDAAALASAGDPFQKYEQGLLDTQYGNFLEAKDYPKDQLQTIGSTLGQNYGQQSTGPGPNRAAGALGGAASGAALGSSFGPYGALIGGAGGAIAGSRGAK